MREQMREPTTGGRSRTQRVVGVVAVVFWASAALMMVLVVLSWIVPGRREAWSFNLLGGTCAGLALVCSAYLFWQELRSNRQMIRAVRRESRDVPVEEGDEWTPRAWLYGIAFGFSFLLSWYLIPALFFSF
jgi:hypothetical protein